IGDGGYRIAEHRCVGAELEHMTQGVAVGPRRGKEEVGEGATITAVGTHGLLLRRLEEGVELRAVVKGMIEGARDAGALGVVGQRRPLRLVDHTGPTAQPERTALQRMLARDE